MKTRSRWFHLRGLFLLSVGLTCGFALCASALAGTSTSSDELSLREQRAMQKLAHKRIVYYCISSASAIPKPCTWVSGTFPTTAVPMEVYGRQDVVTR